MAQVGSGEVAIVPTFKGFRRAVSSEVDGSAKQASSGFTQVFAKTGTDSGKASGAGFKKAFESAADGASSKATKQLEQDVAKAARAVSTARLKEQDAAGKVRVAEKQLAEAREKYAADSSQVVRAQERLESATRQLGAANERTQDSTNDLRQAQKRLADAADDVGDEFEEAGRSSGNRFTSGFGKLIAGVSIGSFIGNFASNVMSSIGNAIQDGLRAGFDFLRDSVSLASDLQQSMGAVDAVFKDNAGTIRDWAAGAAQAVGLSTSSYNEFATVVGAQLKNMAIPLDEVTGLTGGLIELGADLAAQFGGSTADAVSAISSLLRGERDPIERYGVSMKQVDINARLAAQGLSGLEGEALKQAEAQAALAILMEQTADAQGTFGRESDTLAGQQARLTAEWENAQAKLGTALIPALTTLTDMANTTLIPVLNEVIEQVGPLLGQALADSAPMIGDLITEIAPLLPELARMGAELLPLIIQGLIDISPFLIDMAKNFATNWEILNGFLSWLDGDSTFEEFMTTVMNGAGSLVEFGNQVGSVISGVTGWFAHLAASIGAAVATAVNWVTGLRDKVVDAVRGAGDWLYNSGKAIIEGFINGIKSMLGSVGDAVGGVLDFAKSFFPHSPAKRGPLSGAGWRSIAEGGASLIEQFEAGFGDGPAVPFALSSPSAASASAVGAGGLWLRPGDRLTLVVEGTPLTAVVQAGIGAYDRAQQQASVRRFRGGA
ncbi:phage tail protein [Agromyces larvae]|uniref:Phage tail protein n=1 Tax=Agromyces larvae TaxID=2929802 RepID=A0ABY4C2C3_9MICO|nr:hypothetical protein [Agromyces larvae]UOE45469.1 hypothetical protein MTO99_06850 [Agromyces larvae]